MDNFMFITLVGNYVLAVQQRQLHFFNKSTRIILTNTISNVILLTYTKYYMIIFISLNL